MRALFEKVKTFVIENKKKILSLLGIVAIIALISLVTYGILLLTGVVDHTEDGLEFNVELFDDYKNRWYGALIVVVLQTVLTMLLCFIPGVSMAFIMLINSLYGNPITAFFVSFSSVVISSSVLYILGRFGGYKLCVKLLGEEDTEKSMTLLRDNGTVYFPLMMALPMFPDDALTMVAGTMKMRLSWFVPSIVVGRGIGVAAIVFGMSAFLPSVENVYDWVILITILAFGLYVILYLAGKLNKMMAEKRAGTYVPLKERTLKKCQVFGIITAALVTLIYAAFCFVPSFLPKTLSIYRIFELLVIGLFIMIMAYLGGQSTYRSYKRAEKHGRISLRRVRPTLATVLPFAISIFVLGAVTAVGLLVHFFPKLSSPYEWIVLIAAYLIWTFAIYIITGKIRILVRKIHLKKQKTEA